LVKGELAGKSVHGLGKNIWANLVLWLRQNRCASLLDLSFATSPSGRSDYEIADTTEYHPTADCLEAGRSAGVGATNAAGLPGTPSAGPQLSGGRTTRARVQTTALVNEAFVRLIDWQGVDWQNRAHFFGVSSKLMRHILVQFAREQQAAKRGGQAMRISLSEAAAISTGDNPDLVAVDDALTTLERLDPRQARTVELRFFGGLNLEEVAEVLRISVSSVRRDWRMAQAWLHQQLSPTA
jgi:RNA polymerase sigma factor (TIGR02999 family)